VFSESDINSFSRLSSLGAGSRLQRICLSIVALTRLVMGVDEFLETLTNSVRSAVTLIANIKKRIRREGYWDAMNESNRDTGVVGRRGILRLGNSNPSLRPEISIHLFV
jgi:hypothetical protein